MTRPHSAGSVRLSIARHGEAHCNTSGTICGSSRCTGLTDRGRHQARRLADRLARESPVTAVYTSTVARAEILADALGLPVNHDPRLTPPDPGAHLDGQTWPVARTVWPTDPDNPDRPLAPGGEPWTNHVHRVTAALADITNSEADGHVLVVGHAETVTAAYQIFLAAPVLHRITLPVGHASLTQWRTSPNVPTSPSPTSGGPYTSTPTNPNSTPTPPAVSPRSSCHGVWVPGASFPRCRPGWPN